MSQQRTWFITGAGSGFGLQLTRQLLARGDRVAATTRSSFDTLYTLQAEYPEQLWIARLDMTETQTIEPAVKAALNHFGTIDVLVSNAGYVLLGALEELSAPQIDHQLNTNLRGPIFLIRAFLPFMRAQGHGRIVQIASEGGQITYPALTLYHATKWGVEGFCESLAREVAALDIQVMIVEPGRTATAFDNNAVTSETSLEAYQHSTVGQYKKLLLMGKFPNKGDAAKVAARIIEATDAPTMPLRLTLGEDAYKHIEHGLKARLAALQAQRDLAHSTSRSDGIDRQAPKKTPRQTICKSNKNACN